MTGALETLCGQACGAEQYRKLGIYTYCSVVAFTFVCLPVSLFWIFEERLLVLLGWDPSVSKQAGRYSIFLLPALFGYAVLLSLFELGTAGAALSLGLSYWLSVMMMLGTYIKCFSVCEKTQSSFTIDVFSSICLEWWSYELLILVLGTLPNSKLETSVLSISLTTTSLHYLISSGISAAASTRVSNELGAGNPKKAPIAVYAGVILTVVETVIVGITLFCCRTVLGYAYSNEKEDVDYVKEIAPLLSLSVLMDGLQAVFSGMTP
ncbi:hypothetical protein TIFTF001_001978 [Ficus carica]|uniref:Uncharacterized protein n=1 Tax=Ficus carica TaxID=3494 RepID=A0AA87ZJQ3_FICCA|nr:hypothetical protein TIFTF001_001978 [Ficus carica]